MRQLCLSTFLGLALLISAKSANAEINSPHFHVTLLPAVTSASPDETGIVYTQPFLPMSAVKTTSDIKTTLKTHIIAGGGGSPLTIPAGTLLIEAEYEQSPVYCTTIQQKKPNWLGAYDLGLCLKDTHKTGRFTDAIYFTPPAYGRERGAYEALDFLPFFGSKPRIETIDTGYDTVAVDDGLRSNILISLFKPPFSSKFMAETHLEFAEQLNNDPGTKIPTALGDEVWWPGNKATAFQRNVAVVNVQDGAGELALGQNILAKITLPSEGKPSLDWAKTYPVGPAELSLIYVGITGSTSSPSLYLVFAFKPLDATTPTTLPPEGK